MKPPKLIRKLVVDAGNDGLARRRSVVPYHAARLNVDPVAVEERIELVEGGDARSAGADQEQVAFGKLRLDGRHAERLKQLRLEELADPRDLMARQHRVRVREEAMRREVARVGVDRFPAFDEGELLEAEIGVDAARLALRAARSESSSSRDR